MSLPMRERELKRGLRDELGEHVLSLPMRERELKLACLADVRVGVAVAPHAGA